MDIGCSADQVTMGARVLKLVKTTWLAKIGYYDFQAKLVICLFNASESQEANLSSKHHQLC